MKVVVFRSSENGQWYFRILDEGNHQIISTSEGYHNKADCIDTASNFGDPEVDEGEEQ